MDNLWKRETNIVKILILLKMIYKNNAYIIKIPTEE